LIKGRGVVPVAHDPNDKNDDDERDIIRKTLKEQGIEGRYKLLQMEQKWEKEDGGLAPKKKR